MKRDGWLDAEVPYPPVAEMKDSAPLSVSPALVRLQSDNAGADLMSVDRSDLSQALTLLDQALERGRAANRASDFVGDEGQRGSAVSDKDLKEIQATLAAIKRAVLAA